MEGGVVRVSSLRVRNAVLHDLTAASDDDDAAIGGITVWELETKIVQWSNPPSLNASMNG